MVRLALLGAGRIGRVHARAISMVNDAYLKYVFDPVADASQLVVDAYGAISAPIEDILDDSEVDGVLICTPSDQHADQIKRAIKAGKAVFCEKPISTDLDTTQQVLEVVAAARNATGEETREICAAALANSQRLFGLANL